jgi:hypothetical protein
MGRVHRLAAELTDSGEPETFVIDMWDLKADNRTPVRPACHPLIRAQNARGERCTASATRPGGRWRGRLGWIMRNRC